MNQKNIYVGLWKLFFFVQLKWQSFNLSFKGSREMCQMIPFVACDQPPGEMIKHCFDYRPKIVSINTDGMEITLITLFFQMSLYFSWAFSGGFDFDFDEVFGVPACGLGASTSLLFSEGLRSLFCTVLWDEPEAKAFIRFAVNLIPRVSPRSGDITWQPAKRTQCVWDLEAMSVKECWIQKKESSFQSLALLSLRFAHFHFSVFIHKLGV